MEHILLYASLILIWMQEQVKTSKSCEDEAKHFELDRKTKKYKRKICLLD